MRHYPKTLANAIEACTRFLKRFNGNVKAIDYVAYLPKNEDVILKIREDEFAVLFIKLETARKILKEQSLAFRPGVRDYMLEIEAYLDKNSKIDWYECLLACNSNEMYNEGIRNDVPKNRDSKFNENNYKYVEFVKDIILKHASLMKQIIVYDKQQEAFVQDLFLYARSINNFIISRQPAIKLCMANQHMIVAYNIED